MPDLPPRFFEARDGTRLAYRELGSGRPLVLIHGFFSTAMVNWVRYGHAQTIAERGFRLIMPDLRGHGDSAKSHDPSAYPADVLTDDGLALIRILGLEDYDLGGYSLGARTALRMLLRGAAPRRAVAAGMGLEGMVDAHGRGEFFRRVLTNPGTFPRGSAEWMAEAFLKTVSGDAQALLAVLDTAVDTPREALRGIMIPTLVAAGEEDRDNGSAAPLAAALGDGRYVALPGNHMSAVTKPQLAAAIVDFLAPP
ncbi:MAG TPA: alpha/beta fold hydrolase [Steroidobacteraceae bacterium]|nr:alpha/beta fold hydrolase [Steroidobacteraceae bacterium]